MPVQAVAMSPVKRFERIIDDWLHNVIAGEEALPFDGDDESEPRPFSGLAVHDALMNLVYDTSPLVTRIHRYYSSNRSMRPRPA